MFIVFPVRPFYGENENILLKLCIDHKTLGVHLKDHFYRDLRERSVRVYDVQSTFHQSVQSMNHLHAAVPKIGETKKQHNRIGFCQTEIK